MCVGDGFLEEERGIGHLSRMGVKDVEGETREQGVDGLLF